MWGVALEAADICFLFVLYSHINFRLQELTHILCHKWPKLLPNFNCNSGTLLQFLLGHVRGVSSFTLSPEINVIIIQIGIVLTNTRKLNSRTKPSLSIGLNVLLLVLFGWTVMSVATNEDAWCPAFTSLMLLNNYSHLGHSSGCRHDAGYRMVWSPVQHLVVSECHW